MARTKLKNNRGLVVSFDFENERFITEPIKLPENVSLEVLKNVIDGDLIDVCEYNDEIDIVVDDEGLLKSGLPVFWLHTPYGEYQLAGKLLFMKKEKTNDGIKLTGMNIGDVYCLLNQLNGSLGLIGVTK